ncbi:sclerostin domain-containing protein 1-like isoform X2 [Tachypleus tridentatus]|uniref:sclerostin domain-containing protein 1-like isoform X2 n=1 Tax=Tachypleus tridentatus TaxID=6853 RepID=UPI003FD3A1F9
MHDPMPVRSFLKFRARQIGKKPSERTFQGVNKDAQLGCVELRSKRYFSDGYCTSIRPITEVVCSGICLPVRYLTWYHLFLKQVPRKKDMEWRCIEDGVRRKRVRLVCRNGERRKYKIKIVTSCKCVRRKRARNKKSPKNSEIK